jgi:hypothetical protein
MDHYMPQPNQVIKPGRPVVEVFKPGEKESHANVPTTDEFVTLSDVDQQLNSNLHMELPPMRGFVGCPYKRTK